MHWSHQQLPNESGCSFSKPPKVLQRLGSQIVKPGDLRLRQPGQCKPGPGRCWFDSFSIDLFFFGGGTLSNVYILYMYLNNLLKHLFSKWKAPDIDSETSSISSISSTLIFWSWQPTFRKICIYIELITCYIWYSYDPYIHEHCLMKTCSSHLEKAIVTWISHRASKLPMINMRSTKGCYIPLCAFKTAMFPNLKKKPLLSAHFSKRCASRVFDAAKQLR